MSCMNEMLNGRIIKGIGGFYYVETDKELYSCKARGVSRKKRITPLVGDQVQIRLDADGTGYIEEILPRKNFLTRPPVANIDQLIVVTSVCDPSPNPLLIDEAVAAAEDKGIEPVVVVSKTDLQSGEWLREIYEKAGIPFFAVSSVTDEGVEAVKALLKGKITAFTGNSGVGKSSVLNCLAPALCLQTGAVSEKLGRGRHTTRHVELYALDGETFVADTPGFSSFDTDQMELIWKEDLQYAFPDFAPYLGRCRFRDCAHLKEPDCAVTQALREGKLQPTRYDSYVRLYEKAREVKARQWN